jgi:F-type H+-transporting ATPase subunit epsilon
VAEPKLQVRVVTPEASVYAGVADLVVVPAHDGEVGILPRHARLLASLGLGELRITSGTTLLRFFLEGGFVQVRDDHITVLCERAVPLEALDVTVAEAEAERARAEQGAAKAVDAVRRATVMRRVAERRQSSS